MNNNLSENLRKLRKDNNLSQEDLAEILSVSRQAISKWESGTAYPEMEKIIILCKRFNLNIDDLLYKDIREVKNEEISKNNISKFIDDFLQYIKDTINLFCNMTFKSKIRCLFEQLLLSGILFIICLILGDIFDNLIHGVFSSLPYKAFNILHDTLCSLFYTLLFIITFGVLIYIYKSRYLDYYIQNKKIEIEYKSVDNENKSFPKEDNKIIIRDPQDVEYRFINSIIKLFVLGIKLFLSLFLICFCLLDIVIFATLICSFLLFNTGTFFVGLLISLISCGIINSIIILLLINFIFNRNNNKKKMILSFMISLIFLGVGCGLIFIGSLDFNYINESQISNNMFTTETISLEMNNDIVFINSWNNNYDYIEKDIDNVIVEIKSNKIFDKGINNYEDHKYYIYNNCENPFPAIREFLYYLNKKQLISFDSSSYEVKIYASKYNIEIIKNNINSYYKSI